MNCSRGPRCGVAVLIVLALVCRAEYCAADDPAKTRSAPAADPEGEVLKKTVIAGIRRNYARIPSVRCKQELTITDRSVKQPAVIRGMTDDGGLVETKVAPQMTIESDLILVRDNLRADLRDADANERWSVSMHNQIRTEYRPRSKRARREYREDMGGEINIDPRNVGAFEQRKVFLDELASLKVARHEFVERQGEKRLVLHLDRWIPEASLKVTTRFEFNPSQNYLPTRIVFEEPESHHIVWVHDFEYQEVVPRSAWFLKKSQMRTFGKEAPKSPEDEAWTWQMVNQIVGPVVIDETFADSAFEIDIPAGVDYIDQTVGRPRPKKAD